jgi:hypothetical protein
MEGRKIFSLVVLGTASVFVLVALLVVLKSGMMASRVETTGLVIAEESSAQKEGRDIIEINNDELVKCCSFKNELGIEDSCFVIKRYDCSYCSEACENNA